MWSSWWHRAQTASLWQVRPTFIFTCVLLIEHQMASDIKHYSCNKMPSHNLVSCICWDLSALLCIAVCCGPHHDVSSTTVIGDQIMLIGVKSVSFRTEIPVCWQLHFRKSFGFQVPFLQRVAKLEIRKCPKRSKQACGKPFELKCNKRSMHPHSFGMHATTLSSISKRMPHCIYRVLAGNLH